MILLATSDLGSQNERSLSDNMRLNAMALKLLLTLLTTFIYSCGSEVVEQHHLFGEEDSNLTETPFWQVNKQSDPTLNRSHSLYRYFAAAQAKKLPTNYFRDIISIRGAVSLRYADWPRYQPRGGGGTIYHPKVGRPFSEWKALDWSSFYNELFHAWWGTVFTKSSKYAADRAALLTSERRAHYRKANPRNALLAQEEAYSETMSSLALFYYPKYNPHAASRIGYLKLDFYEYNTNKTVSAVGHSDRPGYTPAAETTFPNRAEYAIIFRQITDLQPPQ
jgi:hypothetical protein